MKVTKCRWTALLKGVPTHFETSLFKVGLGNSLEVFMEIKSTKNNTNISHEIQKLLGLYD